MIKADNWLYYSVGNDNSGGLSKKQMPETQLGFNLSHSTGAELFVPGATPLIPPDNNMISFFVFAGDKPGKDTNFRGMTIFDDTTRSMWQKAAAVTASIPSISSVLRAFYPLQPTPPRAVWLANLLRSFLDSPTPLPAQIARVVTILIGIWFANASTLYVCDERDLIYTPNQVINGQVNVADTGTLATAGLQKWVLTTTATGSQWEREYVIQNGLDLGVPYSVPNYPASIEPATGGCRNIIGVVDDDGIATIYAITSTISQNGDNGADPNKLVKVTDLISASQPATNGHRDRFVTHARPAPAKRSAASP